MLTSTVLIALAGLASFTSAAPMEKRASAKRGLGFKKDLQSKASLFPSASWGYDWEARVSQQNDYSMAGKEYVPMLHDNGPIFAPVWESDVTKAIKAGAKNILSFNEPDEKDKSKGGTDMPLTVAVPAHQKYIQNMIAAKYKNVRIGSPAVTNGPESTKGLAYLKDFLAGCTGCRIDFVAAHWYNGGSVKNFQDYFTKMNKETGKPIWVTEWAAPGGNKQFMTEAMAWMDKTPFIERYAYFNVEEALTAGNGLTDLGRAYA